MDVYKICYICNRITTTPVFIGYFADTKMTYACVECARNEQRRAAWLQNLAIPSVSRTETTRC